MRPYRVGDTIKFVGNKTLLQGVILKKQGNTIIAKNGNDEYTITEEDIRQLVSEKPVGENLN